MVSIIICFYERLHHLECCLNTLKFNSEHFAEIILTDDGSCPETVSKLQQLIQTYDFPIHHIWHKKDGFRLAAARNRAIRAAKGDYLIFLDCDFAILPGTINRHLRHAKRGRFVAGLCKYLPQKASTKLLEANITPAKLCALYENLPPKQINREHFKFIKYAILRRLHLVNARKPQCSSHFSIHRQDMEYINGYDENFVGWGGEDEDLSTRMQKAGMQGYSIIKKAKVMHIWHTSELGGKSWEHGSNVKYLHRKNIPYRCKNGLTKL